MKKEGGRAMESGKGGAERVKGGRRILETGLGNESLIWKTRRSSESSRLEKKRTMREER